MNLEILYDTTKMEMVKDIRRTERVAASTKEASNTGTRLLQRKARAFNVHRSSEIQTKLQVNTPGDRFEQEADHVSEKVMRMENAVSMSHQPGSNNNSQAQTKRIAPSFVSRPLVAPLAISRKTKDAGEEKLIQKKERDVSTVQSTSHQIEPVLRSTKGSGQELSGHTNAFMSRAMGADFSKVRVHSDAKAANMNKRLNAHAFTHGRDIYFNSGMYDPDSAGGRKLLAHELVHVVQQGAATRVQRKENETAEPILRSTNPEKDKLIVQRKASKVAAPADVAFQSVVKKIKSTATQAKAHEPAAKKAKAAQSAAKPPANEKAAKAKDRKAGEMAQQEPGKFDEEKFKAALRAKIAQLQLNSLQQAEDFKKNNGAAGVKGDMTQQVDSEKDKAAGNIEKKTQEEPVPGKETGKDVGPTPSPAAGIAPPSIDTAAASPKPATADVVSLEQGSKGLDDQMKAAKVTDKQLEKSNEPAFQAAIDNKKTAQKDAITAPQQFRKDEKGIIGQAQQAAGTAGKMQMTAIAGSRKKMAGSVLSKQEEAKAKDEQARAKVAADIDLKFAVTKTDVQNILTALDKDVSAMFDAGIANATKLFEEYVDHEVQQFKINRYLVQPGGLILWGYDLLQGPPEEINTIYRNGKNKYIQAMDVVIGKASGLVVRQLNAAKMRINAGKQEIKSYVESLPKSLQSVGAEAAQKIQGQFAELESSVDNKQNELVDNLAAKYQAGLENIDKKIADMKEANKGLIDQAKEAIAEVIDTIIEFKNFLMNVLAKASAAIDLIIEDPIKFLGNLIAGVKAGVMAFMNKIGEHLKAGLMGWLFGTLAKAGIQMPKTFDLKGILSLILQVLGLTYANIRSRAVAIVGEKIVAGMEKVAEIFIIIKNEGIGGLWKFIKEKVEALKDTVINSIKEFVIQKIVVAGVTWIISLLNPASAFIKACKLIYDVIMFFVTRGRQILELVNAVVDSVTAIAKGAIGVAASAVENALAKALPVALGFLASLLGLDGISDKIKAVIVKIQAPINAAIDWVIQKAVMLVKGVAGLFSGGKTKEDKKSDYGPEKQGKIDAGIIFMKQEEARYLKNGKMKKSDADKVAASVKSNHNVFSSFTTKEIGEKIKFLYTASAQTEAGEVDQESSDMPDKRFIPPSLSPKGSGDYIRKKLYINMSRYDSDSRGFRDKNQKAIIGLVNHAKQLAPGTTRDSEWRILKEQGHIDPGADIEKYDPSAIKYQVDHKQDISIHWNIIGHNDADGERISHTMNQNDWEVKTVKANQGKKKEPYLDYVGRNFKSKKVSADGKTIDNVRFNNEKGESIA